MKKNMMKILLTAAVLVLMVFSVLQITGVFEPKEGGEITIRVIDLEGNVIKEKNIKFYKEDTLVELIENNFNGVLFSDGMILNIEGIETPSDWSYFISVYKNSEMSQVGIANIEFKDKDVIELRVTEYIQNYENN